MKKLRILLLASIFFSFQFSLNAPLWAQVDTTGRLTSTQEVTNPLPPDAADSISDPMPTYGYSLLARSYGDSIVLRWAVDNSAAWLTGNKYGWRVFRSGGSGDTTVGFIEISDHNKPVKPMTLKEMTSRFPKSNKMAGIAAQALYGRNFNPEKLSVTKATDEQGMQNAIFRQYQEQTQRQIFAYMAAETDGQIASALGMRFVDRNVKKGEYYTYYLEPVYQSKLYVVGLSTVSLECNKFERGIDEQMTEIDVVQTNTRECIVRWHKNELSGYYVERSLDGGKTWKDLSGGVPTWSSSSSEEIRQVYGDSIANWMNDYVLFIDSLPLKSKALWRVRGFDAFGELTPWQTSMEFTLEDVTPPVPPMFTYIAPIENRYCQIEWSLEENTPDLKGFFISFSEDISGPWDVITAPLRPTQFKYVDSLAGQRGRGYYRVFAVDSSGNTSYSVAAINHIEDVTPPARPKGLKAVADSTGRVFISWDKLTEKDLKGYKLLSANDIHHDFIPVFSVYTRDNYYIDSIDIRSLTKKIYYTLYATDYNNNVSKYSDTVEVELPDVVPPALCAVDRVIQSSDSVQVWWIPSASEDVWHYLVYRKPRGTVRWENIATIPSDKLTADRLIYFVDKPQPSDRPYSYCIEAIDSSYLSSGRGAEIVATINGGMEVPLSIKLSGKFVKKSHSVSLEWNYKWTAKTEPRGLLYRSVGDGEWKVVTDITDMKNTFIDRNVPNNTTVMYYVVMEMGGGKFSTPSNVVILKTPKN